MKIPRKIPLDKEDQYCINCLTDSSRLKRVYGNEDSSHYECLACHEISPRRLIIDNSIVWWLDEERNFWHETVGVVILNKESKILCLLGQTFPFSYSLPAAHLDREESAETAALREITWEVGLRPTTPLELLSEFDMNGDSCRRGSDDHRWHLFRLKIDNESDVRVSKALAQTEWFSLAELKKKDYLSYSLTYIVEKFGESLVSK